LVLSLVQPTRKGNDKKRKWIQTGPHPRSVTRVTDQLAHKPTDRFLDITGLRFFMSTTARIKSAVGPFGPGLIFCFGENSSRYLRCTNAR
jgi:hypothetical protein